VGGGVQLGPLGTPATDWPIVPAPGDYDDGEFGGMEIGRGGENPPLSPPQIPLDKTAGSNPGRRGGKPATNRLSYGAALSAHYNSAAYSSQGYRLCTIRPTYRGDYAKHKTVL
jgi:hypothetical protein